MLPSGLLSLQPALNKKPGGAIPRNYQLALIAPYALMERIAGRARNIVVSRRAYNTNFIGYGNIFRRTLRFSFGETIESYK
jgi:hypothetical protein